MRFLLLCLISLSMLVSCDGTHRVERTVTTQEPKATTTSSLLKKKSYVRDLFLESARRTLFGNPDTIRLHAGGEAYTKMLELLNGEAVQLSLDPLIDNRGNAVAALGVPGKITLYVGTEGNEELGWERLMARGQVFEQIVFHELLRAADVDDDNYKITRKVLPYYLNFKLTSDLVPVTADDIVREGAEFSHPTLDGSIPAVRSYMLSLGTSAECAGAWCKVSIERNGDIIHTYPNPGEDAIAPVGLLTCRALIKYENEILDFDSARIECNYMISEPNQL